MNYLENIGRKRTIIISICVLLVSLHTIYFYSSVVPEIEDKKIAQQIVRFILTVGLLYMVYTGKNWARIISIILFSLGILGAVFGALVSFQSIQLKIPFLVMIFVYSVAVYHFGFSKSFKAFFSYQNSKMY